MPQQINLYRFLPKEVKFPLNKKQIIILYLLFIFVLMFNTILQLQILYKTYIKYESTKKEHVEIEQKIVNLVKNYPFIDINQLDNSIKKLQQELQVKSQAINLFSRNSRFSLFLKLLASINEPYIWLTDIELSIVDAEVNLRGQALQPLIAQQYLNKLNKYAKFNDMQYILKELTQMTEKKTTVTNFYITSQSSEQ